MSAIDDLVSEAGKLAVRPVARKEGEAEKWLSDFEAYTRARMTNVHPLPDALRPLVGHALDEWKERESSFLDAIGTTRIKFLQRSAHELQAFTPESRPLDIDIAMIGEQNAGRHTVPNIKWVETFAWILPLADPHNAVVYRQVGELMATIFGYEAMLKWPQEVPKFQFLQAVARRKTAGRKTTKKQLSKVEIPAGNVRATLPDDRCFSTWSKWTDRANLANIGYPGVYVLAISQSDISGGAFSWSRDVVYIGMSNSRGGLKVRLNQFANTIRGGEGHGGGCRFRFKHDNYEALVSTLYVAVCPFSCDVTSNAPEYLRCMGRIASFEFECMATFVEKFHALPEFNDKQKSPKK